MDSKKNGWYYVGVVLAIPLAVIIFVWEVLLFLLCTSIYIVAKVLLALHTFFMSLSLVPYYNGKFKDNQD